nr:glycoside hydrolase family 2 TIM barrel-domain containing protein [Bacteroides intestinalis]
MTKNKCRYVYRWCAALMLWCGWALCYGAVTDGEREVVNLNREWTYQRGDFPGAEQTGYDDSGWEHIGLPHSFSIPYFMLKDFYTGYGWYRKTLELSKKDLKKDLFLEFDGVFQEAEVYVNGELAGAHRGGYTGFNVRITPYARRGQNQIAIRVNNLWQPDLAPRGGEHVFSGGIYRNVRLVKKHPVHIDWYGTFVTTPTLEANAGRSSTVHVRTEVRNNAEETEEYRLKIQVIDDNGHTVAACDTMQRVEAGQTVNFEQTTETIPGVALWHPSHPHLYVLVSELYSGNKLVDREETPFGFRWFRWTADGGFFLNGEHFFFHGANVHQDQAGWGDAVTEEATRRDVRMIKEAGFDMIRGSHYPHSPAFSEACDREGLLFWSECPFWATAGPKVDGSWTASAYPVKESDIEGFERNVLQQLEEMIRIHHNHPSVFVWSMSNEPFFTVESTIPSVKRLLEKLVNRAHELDPTRPAAVGGAQRPLGADRIDRIGDVAGYNGDGANIADFQSPGHPSVVTEYGSTFADRPGEYIPGWGDLARDEGWKGRTWRGGQVIWCGFDHGSIFGDYMAKLGIVDYFRLPKRSWYWYRNEYTHQAPPQWPVEGQPARLRLTALKTKDIRTDGTDDVQLIVTVLDAEGRELSNSPDVRLSVVSGPGEFPTGRSITFSADSDIRIQDGKAAIALRAYYAGRTIVVVSSEGLESARLELEFVDGPHYREGHSWQVEERPYVRFVSEQVQKDMQWYGPDSPVFASSSAPGYSSGLAADGEISTYWLPADDDVRPSLTLDVERTLMLRMVKSSFAEGFAGRCVVEVSADGKQWQAVADAVSRSKGKWDIQLEKPVKARFVRFSFTQGDTSVRPALAEVEAGGTVAE